MRVFPKGPVGLVRLGCLAAILLFTTCCGVDIDFYLIEDDGRFYRYRQFFEKHTGHNTGKIPIMYGKEEVLASCRSRQFDVDGKKWHQKHIVVSQRKFDGLSVNWRRAIIAHELIHCHLEVKNHIEDPEAEGLQLMAAELPIYTFLSEEALIEAMQPWVR